MRKEKSAHGGKKRWLVEKGRRVMVDWEDAGSSEEHLKAHYSFFESPYSCTNFVFGL